MAVTAEALEQEDGSCTALQELQEELVKVNNNNNNNNNNIIDHALTRYMCMF
jgi:hypothetical protein